MSDSQNKPGCLAAILRAFAPKPQADYPYHRRDSIITPAELNFYRVLQTAVGDKLLIFPQVPISNLIYAKTGDRRKNAHYRGKISCKRVDFVLCDPDTLRPRAAIELDDASHKRADRVERDTFVENALKAANLPLIRIPVRTQYAPADLRALIRETVIAHRT